MKILEVKINYDDKGSHQPHCRPVRLLFGGGSSRYQSIELHLIKGEMFQGENDRLQEMKDDIDDWIGEIEDFG